MGPTAAPTPINARDIFGKITPPNNSPLYGDPGAAASQVVTLGLNLALIVAAFLTFVYAMWGALDYLTSEGEKEGVAKARKKITAAFIGLIAMFAILAIFPVVSGDILGIIRRTPNGNWIFTIPTFRGGSGAGSGGTGAPSQCSDCGYYNDGATACQQLCTLNGRACSGPRQVSCGSITNCFAANCQAGGGI